MTDDECMKLAITEAENSLKAGGIPIGAVMVKEGKVIAKGQSLVWPEKDPTSHGETNCIRAACKVLSAIDLKGCTLYSTLESCSMCLACASWAGVTKIVFGAFAEDIPHNPYEISDYHAVEWGKKLSPPIEIIGGVLRSECAKLMENYKNWTPIN